jgi:hypothetical protein
MTSSYSRKHKSSYLLLWEPQISHSLELADECCDRLSDWLTEMSEWSKERTSEWSNVWVNTTYSVTEVCSAGP